MKNSTHFSVSTPVFKQLHLPEKGWITGYAAIIQKLKLSVPMQKPIVLVSSKSKRYITKDFIVFPKIYEVTDSLAISKTQALYKHLVFALKYEGVNLLFFKKLASSLSIKELEELVGIEPTGQYSRRIWFLIEWLTGKNLPNIKDLEKKNYVNAVDEKLQYTINGEKSPRHMVINNLSGTVDFCPLINKTPKLEQLIKLQLNQQKNLLLNQVHKDILQRATAYLLLKDSKASFSIEGEQPRNNRAVRWGQAIGQAGVNDLDENELIRLQELVIENKRFIKIGIREQQGFIGDRDRSTQEPIPEHISAKYQDLNTLMHGWYKTKNKLLKSDINPVLAATLLAFGFVFIHPLVDGNGRIHRYIIHHILAKMNYTEQEIIFPVSTSILLNISNYQKTLSSYSIPLLDIIKWESASDKNVEIRNETIDYYRYFDATDQAEFLFDCVKDTIENIIPNEFTYLQRFDKLKSYLETVFEMPDNMISLLVGFLEQGNGKLSKRALKKEFS